MAAMDFDLNQELQDLAGRLDIPPQLAELAVSRYHEVADWLGEENSPLRDYSTEIYTQGSFRLGTIIKPSGPDEGYDIDLVCRLEIDKDSTTQADLKKMVGDRLFENSDFRDVLDERRRCWTLDYPRQFHLDILPAIPDPESDRDSILITDTELARWQFSNPIAYSNWFFGRMRTALDEARMQVAKSTGVNIEDVPEWSVRTPLQRAVQLLKLHRNKRFESDEENRPVSIIITTLAASAYSGQGDIESALIKVVREMPNFIENRKGKWWVPNPAHPDENFADKWNEAPARRESFLAWLRLVFEDIGRTVVAKSAQDKREKLDESFGVRRRESNIAVMTSSVLPTEYVPPLASTNHVKEPEWPQRKLYNCSVRGEVFAKRKAKSRLWALADRPVSKGSELKFEARTDAPSPYEVKWRVTNTGEEAKAARGLRGDFYPSDAGSNGRWESTAYAGTHFVEAFIIRNGVCVARSDRKLVRIKA
jgi:hypothetical protein